LAGLKTEGAERRLTESTCRSSKLNLILAEVGTRPGAAARDFFPLRPFIFTLSRKRSLTRGYTDFFAWPAGLSVTGR